MNQDLVPLTAPAFHASVASARPEVVCTFTLELPVAAQAVSPGERPLGSIAKIEVKPSPESRTLAPPVSKKSPATLTF